MVQSCSQAQIGALVICASFLVICAIWVRRGGNTGFLGQAECMCLVWFLSLGFLCLASEIVLFTTSTFPTLTLNTYLSSYFNDLVSDGLSLNSAV